MAAVRQERRIANIGADAPGDQKGVFQPGRCEQNDKFLAANPGGSETLRARSLVRMAPSRRLYSVCTCK